MLWRRQWHPTPVLLPGKSHGRRSLVGCSPWGHWGSDTTEWLHFHFSLSCIGEGNGNPFQCSCLENARDGEACWAPVYGVAQSRTRLKWLCSSNCVKEKNETQTLLLFQAYTISDPNNKGCLYWKYLVVHLLTSSKDSTKTKDSHRHIV